MLCIFSLQGLLNLSKLKFLKNAATLAKVLKKERQHLLEGYCEEAICYLCTNASNAVFLLENNRRQLILLCAF
jgi:hypothetical protein